MMCKSFLKPVGLQMGLEESLEFSWAVMAPGLQKGGREKAEGVGRCTCLVSLQCVVQEKRAGLGAEVVGGGEGEGGFPPHLDEPGWGSRSDDVHTAALGRKKRERKGKKQLNIHQSH